MKISKLFHWLYAILMLLPFAFFVPSILYYAFNDNATMQSVEVPKTETISVDFNQLNKNENFENTDYWLSSGGTSLYVNNNILDVDFSNTGNLYPGTQTFINNVIGHKYLISFNYSIDGHTLYLNYGGYNNIVGANNNGVFSQAQFIGTYSIEQPYLILFTTSNSNPSTSFYISQFNFYDLTKMFGAGNEPTIEQFNAYFPNVYYSYTESELMQITYDTGETMQLVTNTSIVNYAWESIWDLPLFNWCKVSFVSVPFTYITGLFGLAASNSFNYVFTYFASMSIIWLVFDVILYVPLLVHRWLDKGIVE